MSEENTKRIRRAPIVVVVGHVDHGKTTLLDYIRKTESAAKEAGGITQAIGAYQAEHETASGEKRMLTFIDTPGHEAFTGMRARGARVADMAILVVAADEGVKPQTEEAIRILKETKTPFVVAINKMDSKGADSERVKNELAEREVLLEGRGGSVSFHEISAKTGTGIGDLLDLLILAADIEDFTYDTNTPAHGFILETRTNKQRGLEATIIIRDGVLKKSDDVSTATAKGKVKILENFLGNQKSEIHAGSSALVVGFETIPAVGEQFFSGKEAFKQSGDEALVKSGTKEPVLVEEEKNSLRLALKAGDAGSLEALVQIVGAMQLERPLAIIDSKVGDITEGDVKFAVSSGAVILGFKSKVDKAARALAQAQSVHIITSQIVYELVTAIETLIEESKTADVTAVLEVLATFNQKRLDKQLVGGKITRGTFPGKGTFHIERGDGRIGVGRILSLESNKKEVVSAPEGNEAGVVIASNEKIEVGDSLTVEKIRK